ncbi:MULTISPECIES: hemerythrin domain-containing protein [unclassified Candidatus Frackibacter]|uniref:hemerythrin domain-containing protein n=1 Tax=unclassified Candidatus Frackibacter TaxID=2648818 RepID=UPI00087FB500|nr:MULTISPECIES: hemerythrin domain-containing protein [unclassified Candidatus Frackibacter]SDC30050.1 Hemerythrin-like domain-containing protein [Candidatus Frackibacter sp. WG11]SEM94812.1 Hemerythrin-like domain-containing protein [Candidatus Frackibacter sp. WG12]SFL57900.1 Hemerythrin-like domain-containing protein [Candidatus Frackibacter sp. WG13]
MEAIDLLIKEHDNIKRVLAVARKLCLKILEEGEVDFEVFEKIIDFVKNYADDHHHGKEEDILFERMSDELDKDVKEITISAMFSEHDFGRYFISKLETALKEVKSGDEEAKIDIIANAVGYADLLDGHIFKENNMVYNYGKENLSSDTLQEIGVSCKEVEEKAAQEGIQDKYIKMIDDLEQRV